MRVLFLTVILTGVVIQSASVVHNSTTHFEIGTLGPDDVHVVTLESSHDSDSAVNETEGRIGTLKAWYEFSYLIAEEVGGFPDAQIDLSRGGPGHNDFLFNIRAGPSGGWKYVINAYGKKLAQAKWQWLKD